MSRSRYYTSTNSRRNSKYCLICVYVIWNWNGMESYKRAICSIPQMTTHLNTIVICFASPIPQRPGFLL